MSQFVSIGCEGGGPETRLVCIAKVPLAQALERWVKSTHCQAVDKYALVLRVSGTIQKYGDEGLFNLRYFKSRRYVTVDIQIPEGIWQPLSQRELRAYIAKNVIAAVEACVTRLERGISVERDMLLSSIRGAVKEYLAEAS